MVTGLERVACGDAADLILDDFVDEAELPGAVFGLAVVMRGAGLSTFQLHYHNFSHNPYDISVYALP